MGTAFVSAGTADVINVTISLSADALRALYRAADGVLANFGREPFGLVGLETMAAGRTAFTGNSGEEYARHMDNAVVLDTADPSQAAWCVTYLAPYRSAARASGAGTCDCQTVQLGPLGAPQPLAAESPA